MTHAQSDFCTYGFARSQGIPYTATCQGKISTAFPLPNFLMLMSNIDLLTLGIVFFL